MTTQIKEQDLKPKFLYKTKPLKQMQFSTKKSNNLDSVKLPFSTKSTTPSNMFLSIEKRKILKRSESTMRNFKF
jgi:hypothetical protein